MLERLKTSARIGVDSLLVTLFPPSCGACGAALAARPRLGLCAACFETLENNSGERCECCDLPVGGSRCSRCTEAPPAFAHLRAPWLYGGPLADLVVACKFQGREDLATALGQLVCEDDTAWQLCCRADALVPVPLGVRRRRKRGYNQSALMAMTIARATGTPVRHLLRRTHDTQPQSELPLSGRAANVDGVFTTRRAVVDRLVLVDDVVTSTETVRQAAAALVRGGAQEVAVVAAGRTEIRSTQ